MKFKEILREELPFIIIIFMLGVNMIWTAAIIDPVLQIIENQRVLARIAIIQNEEILDKQDTIISILNSTK